MADNQLPNAQAAEPQPTVPADEIRQDLKPSEVESPSSDPDIQSAPTSGGYYWFVIIYLVLLSAFGSFVNDMYIPTLPAMCKAFHCSVSTCQLGLTFGMIGLGLGQMLFGPFSDHWGRKPILYIAMVVFAIGAFCSVWSKSIWEFIWWRLVQGFGASGGYFLARTIPADMYRGQNLAKVMALVGAINGFAPASAPVIGGFVSHAVGWKGIFWILFGFSIMLLILAPALKESLPKARRVKGKFWIAFENYGYLVKNKHFMVHSFLKGAALGLVFAYVSAAPFIIQVHYHYSQLDFGLFMGFNAIFIAFGSTVALTFKPLKKAAVYAARGLFVIVFGQGVCLYLLDNIWVYEAWNVCMIFCVGMIFTVSNTLAMNEGRLYAGDASALLGFIGYVFGGAASPLVGLGDILHSTAITQMVLAALVLVFAHMTKVIPAELVPTFQSANRAGLPKYPKPLASTKDMNPNLSSASAAS
ncbi:MAG: multidrug effflux MFS transporter [Muribaculaceae bacterium]|nr:multidrug effflux MFS transporter [Muribaculaceae bacterium]